MAAAGKPTLMICYSQSDSCNVKKITDSLKLRGYTLFDPMTEAGNPLANMAKGVENCIVILLCVSDAFAKDHLWEKETLQKIPADSRSTAMDPAIDALKQLYIKAKEKQAVKK